MPELRYPEPPLTDGTITLRRWREDDIPAIVAACQDPDIPRWTRVPDPYTEDDARGWLATHADALQEGTGLSLAVTEADSDRVIGSIGVVGAEHGEEECRAEIGYWLARDARGRGAMSAALRLFAGWLLIELGFARVHLFTDVRNTRSQAVAERARFTREGVLRAWEEVKGRRGDFVCFSLLPSDLPAQRSA